MFFKTIILFLILSSQYVKAQQDSEGEPQPEKTCELKINCNLPHCNCESTKSPANFTKFYRKDQIPQLVILTIDDDNLDIKSYQVFKRLLENSSIRATFFLSDTNNQTSYCLVRNLYENKNEIAISTVNYTCPRKSCTAQRDFQPWNYELWIEQILNMRERVHRYSGIAKPEIIGFRAPILEPASDMHYRIIAGNKFLYDSSIAMNDDALFYWPFTLDYEIKTPLNNNGPIKTYPGLWELPVPTYINIDNDRATCTKLAEGQCKIDKTVFSITRFFRQHLLRAYYNNRAPVMIHLNAEWLKAFVQITETEFVPNVGFANAEKRRIEYHRKEYRNLDGLINFIRKTLEFNKDVYFVTAQQAIEWMQTLPRVEQEELDLKVLIEDIIGDMSFKQKLDAKCDYLKQSTPDFDTTESLFLDDDYGKKLKETIDKRLNETVLAGLQSEVLFINQEILYFVLAVCLTLIFIIIYDRLY